MVKIRLRRVGAKKQPHYRVVVTDSHAPRDGKFIETIGNYNPRTDPPTVEIDAGRALYWLSVGAQPSAAVHRMLDKMGILSQVAAVRQGEMTLEELGKQAPPAKKQGEARVSEAEEVWETEAEATEAEPPDEEGPEWDEAEGTDDDVSDDVNDDED